MNDRTRLASGAPWESIAGYSRAVQVGRHIEVAGTTAMRDGNLIGENDMYLQAITILEIIGEAIGNLGGTLEHVVRTRMYVTDISQWKAAAKAHGEVFAQILPATTMVEVSALIDPKILIEIEATAILPSL